MPATNPAETKAPSSLPEILPEGAVWIGYVSKQRYTLTEDATLLGGYYYGSSVAPNGDVADYAPAQLVDWSSIPTPAQPDEPKGFQVGEEVEALGSSISDYATTWLRGNYVGPHDAAHLPGHSVITQAGLMRIVQTHSIRRLSPPQPTSEGPSVPEPVATTTPKVDPYAEHHDRNVRRGIEYPPNQTPARERPDQRIAAAKAQHLADLDRPLLKLGGRWGKRVEMSHPAWWPEADEGEP